MTEETYYTAKTGKLGKDTNDYVLWKYKLKAEVESKDAGAALYADPPPAPVPTGSSAAEVTAHNDAVTAYETANAAILKASRKATGILRDAEKATANSGYTNNSRGRAGYGRGGSRGRARSYSNTRNNDSVNNNNKTGYIALTATTIKDRLGTKATPYMAGVDTSGPISSRLRGKKKIPIAERLGPKKVLEPTSGVGPFQLDWADDTEEMDCENNEYLASFAKWNPKFVDITSMESDFDTISAQAAMMNDAQNTSWELLNNFAAFDDPNVEWTLEELMDSFRIPGYTEEQLRSYWSRHIKERDIKNAEIEARSIRVDDFYRERTFQELVLRRKVDPFKANYIYSTAYGQAKADPDFDLSLSFQEPVQP
ncbi:hypothetical protein BDR26DRAFT_901432 [Obelidium mucronatum]|nr:hypothetical protein BDR26DRAFT_901432 [Obelidium mucronatum]